MPKRGLGYPIADPYPMNSIEKRQVPGLQDASKSKGAKKGKCVPNPNIKPMVMSSK
jgi:hypothetical protein